MAKVITRTGQELARIDFLTRMWQMESVTLRGQSRAETKRRINKWLADFQVMFSSNTNDISLLYGLEGFQNVNLSSKSQGGFSRDDVDKENFESVYRSQTRILQGKVEAQSLFLRNTIAIKWAKGGAEKFYQRWDDYIKEANTLGLSLQEQVGKFLANDANKAFTYLTDSAGRKWQPNHYSTMYARTRGREYEDIVRVSECKELGINLVQVTNAGTTTPICLNYEGKYYYIDTPVNGFTRLPIRAPFHPNCVHRILPVVRENLTKFKNINKNKTKKYNKLPLTDSQKKSVVKQQDWNKINRIQV